MPVMSHMRELRKRLIIALVFIALGGVVGWYLYPHTLEFLRQPYCRVPQKYRATINDTSCNLVYHEVLAGFTTRLKVSVITGAVFTAPFWLYQIWAFITPGLRSKERKWTIIFVIASTLLFAAGMALAFAVLYKGLPILLEQSGNGTSALLDVQSYISFVVLIMVVFGSAFELPLLVVLANFAGVLPSALLRKSQRVAIFLIFLFAAVATPTTDPFTMCAMAVPMVILYEGAVYISTVHDRRKAKRKAEAAVEKERQEAERAAADPVAPDVAPARPAGSAKHAAPRDAPVAAAQEWSDST